MLMRLSPSETENCSGFCCDCQKHSYRPIPCLTLGDGYLGWNKENRSAGASEFPGRFFLGKGEPETGMTECF